MARRRRWLYLLVVLVALAVAGSLLVRHLTRPELLARLLVQQIEQRTGLLLEIRGDPDIRLLPRLSLELTEITLSLADGERLLSAASLQMALPWRALREPVVSLDMLTLNRAEIDLDALWRLADAGDDVGPPPPLRLPPVASHLRLSDSRIASPARGFSLEALQIDSAPLLEGKPWRLNARGRYHGEAREEGRAFVFDLATLPRHTAAGLRLTDFSASLERAGEPPLRASLRGLVELAPPQTGGEVVLKLSRWPRELPELPLGDDLAAPIEASLRWNAWGLGPGEASLRVQRDEEVLEGSVRFGDMLGWLTAGSIAVGPGAAGGLPPPPPLRGSLRMPRLSLEGIEAEGIELILRDAPGEAEP
jgi:nitrogen fixation protein